MQFGLVINEKLRVHWYVNLCIHLNALWTVRGSELVYSLVKACNCHLACSSQNYVSITPLVVRTQSQIHVRRFQTCFTVRWEIWELGRGLDSIGRMESRTKVLAVCKLCRTAIKCSDTNSDTHLRKHGVLLWYYIILKVKCWAMKTSFCFFMFFPPTVKASHLGMDASHSLHFIFTMSKMFFSTHKASSVPT